MSELVNIKDLGVEFQTRDGVVTAVKDVSFSVKKGETLGIVGESGSGKSVTSYALMRILDRAGIISEGSIEFSGIDIRKASNSKMRNLRGKEMSMVFQSPRTALNPIRTVGHQIRDVLLRHGQASMWNAKKKAIELLETVKIRDAQSRYNAYPYELSGGMCQRVVIAIALACQPRLLIADEPTTGLDVTTQKAVMDLIADLTKEREMSTILITHDLGLAAAYCDRIIVMQSGSVIETATPKDLFKNPEHAYTKKLMRATPRIDSNVRDLLPDNTTVKDFPADKKVGKVKEGEKPLLKVSDLKKEFSEKKGWFESLFVKQNDDEKVYAVNGISFEIAKGQSIGLVGESGCGKTTTANMIMGLVQPTSGSVELDGDNLQEIFEGNFKAQSAYRRKLQMVFQDPTDSLNPRFSAARAISDPIRILGTRDERRKLKERVEEVATLVGLPLDLLSRFPHQLSGGQKARVGIARAIALSPQLLILDEPTAALDVSVQAVVLNLLVDLRAKLDMSYLFVSHDLNVVRLLCDEVIVMQNGSIVEKGTSANIMSRPEKAYTKALLDAVPQPPV
ncbi:MAG: dipeptide ABC transporter ATP-binding protein [Methyloligellaceae bacterium]